MSAKIVKIKIYSGAIIFAILAVCIAAHGTVFGITSTTDSISLTSLRGAIIRANSIGGTNTILLLNSTYRLVLTGSDEKAGFTGDLDVTNGKLTIMNLSASKTIIDATALGDRVFLIFTNAQLTLSNLVITGGNLPGNNFSLAEGESGGAIYNSGKLILKNCVVTNNSSGGGNFPEGNGGGTEGGSGGGIYNQGILTMSNCIVAGNFSGGGADGAFGGNGGGIYNVGSCALTNCFIIGNSGGAGGNPEGNLFGFGGGGGTGGGIYNSGTMILRNCALSNNLGGTGGAGGDPGNASIGSPGGFGGRGGDGAGIYNAGILKMSFSTINNNSCGNGGDGASFGAGGNAGAGGNGGGIYNAGTLTLTNCTISSNLGGTGARGGTGFFYAGAAGGAGGSGAGIYNASSLILSSCTVAFNKTGVGGAAGNSGKENSTPAFSGGDGGNGGGIFNGTDGSTVTSGNTLIALNLSSAGGLGGTNYDGSTGNSGADGLGRDASGNFVSQGFNLVGIVDGSTGFTNGFKADLTGDLANPKDPLLGPLQNNGGFTGTHALLLGSPAIDQGKSFGLVTDQRKQVRPHDYFSISNAVGGDGSDIGAFESVLPILSLTKSAASIVISWDTNSPGYILECATNLALPDSWTTAIGTTLVVNKQFRVINQMDSGKMYFRLRSN